MTRVRTGSKGILGDRPEAVRIKLLGGFSVSLGDRTIQQDEWRLRKAANLIKLLALSPGLPAWRALSRSFSTAKEE